MNEPVKAVYRLSHLRYSDDVTEEDDGRIIGIFSSEEKALESQKRLEKVASFVDSSGEFFIGRYTLNEDHWEEGYITV